MNDTKSNVKIIIDALEDKKAENIQIIDTWTIDYDRFCETGNVV